MTRDLVFTPQQAQLVQLTGSAYVEACPGAGKTQAVVQHFIERPGSTDRRGVALLSFTNVAVNEARARCAERPELLRVPNFVGTIDTFINRFCVAPTYKLRQGRSPEFYDTWDSVRGGSITWPKVGRISLSWFDFSGKEAQICRPSMPIERWRTLQALDAGTLSAICRSARETWMNLLGRGIFDAASSRAAFIWYLEDEGIRESLKFFLAQRFSEVIVDEVQDCSGEDVALLTLLKAAGVRLVLVGDPNQAIYGFRGDAPTQLDDLLAGVPRGPKLDGNFRSSPAVCKIVDSLRHGMAVDRPVGRNVTVGLPVAVFNYTNLPEVRAKLDGFASKAGTSKADIVVLAHSASVAQRAAGSSGTLKSSDNKLVRLAIAIHGLQVEMQGGNRRARAMTALRNVIRELGTDDLQSLSDEEYLESMQSTARAMREGLLRLALGVESPFAVKPSVFKARLSDCAWSQKAWGWSPKGLRIPSKNEWPTRPGITAGYSHSTVHGYKGLQAPVVTLVIPDRSGDDLDGLTLWKSQVDGEARRVLYVGASRAEVRLLLAAHVSIIDDVKAILVRDGVPFETI